MVRSQHLERSISFLTDELQVVSKYEAEGEFHDKVKGGERGNR